MSFVNNFSGRNNVLVCPTAHGKDELYRARLQSVIICNHNGVQL